MVILIHMVIIWRLDDEGEEEEERRLIDLRLASPQVKRRKEKGNGAGGEWTGNPRFWRSFVFSSLRLREQRPSEREEDVADSEEGPPTNSAYGQGWKIDDRSHSRQTYWLNLLAEMGEGLFWFIPASVPMLPQVDPKCKVINWGRFLSPQQDLTTNCQCLLGNLTFWSH